MADTVTGDGGPRDDWGDEPPQSSPGFGFGPDANRILEALLGLTAGQPFGGPAGDARPSGAHQHLGPDQSDQLGPECRMCPICRLMAAFRQTRPEVMAHLVAAAEELLAAAREFASPGSAVPPGGRAEQASQDGRAGGASAREGPAGGAAGPARKRPERIEIGE